MRDTRAGGDGLDVCGDVEERSLDAEKCRVRDVELGLVSLDEEAVRRLERGQVLGRLGRTAGLNQNVAVACGRRVRGETQARRKKSSPRRSTRQRVVWKAPRA